MQAYLAPVVRGQREAIDVANATRTSLAEAQAERDEQQEAVDLASAALASDDTARAERARDDTEMAAAMAESADTIQPGPAAPRSAAQPSARDMLNGMSDGQLEMLGEFIRHISGGRPGRSGSPGPRS